MIFLRLPDRVRTVAVQVPQTLIPLGISLHSQDDIWSSCLHKSQESVGVPVLHQNICDQQADRVCGVSSASGLQNLPRRHDRVRKSSETLPSERACECDQENGVPCALRSMEEQVGAYQNRNRASDLKARRIRCANPPFRTFHERQQRQDDEQASASNENEFDFSREPFRRAIWIKRIASIAPLAAGT